ncbi:hypothetical protein HY213_04735 [Candidatus Peregrinibacteria bacterium]|nr:hypothetical protein [Candidatus Peregrinibacteria bacterium]
MKYLSTTVIACVCALAPISFATAMAHEVYVLTPVQVQEGLSTKIDLMRVFDNPEDVRIFLEVTAAVLVLLVVNFLARHSQAGRKLHARLSALEPYGAVIVRVTIAASLFCSAATGSFLGPELSLAMLPLATVLRFVLFMLSGMLLLGIGTEIAAAVTLVLFGVAGWIFGWYMITYANYLGEILVLVLFGARRFSLDEQWIGSLKRFPELRRFESTIARVCYGIALCYAAITIKFLHPELTVMVANQYHLTQFHWLFPSDPLLLTFGAGLAELAIGIFIILGFELRLALGISLFSITLSLLFFGESVWPHLMLYGISLRLFFGEERCTVDQFADEHTLHILRKETERCGCNEKGLAGGQRGRVLA